MWPWGYTSALQDDNDKFRRIGTALATSMNKPYGTRWTSGTMANVQNIQSGNITDWLYGTKQALAYRIDLRDTGQYGFQLPASQIKPSVDEALQGARTLIANM